MVTIGPSNNLRILKCGVRTFDYLLSIVFIFLYFSENAHCQELEGVNDIMTAMLVLVIIQMLVTFVASFVTFCSMYHQEEVRIFFKFSVLIESFEICD